VRAGIVINERAWARFENSWSRECLECSIFEIVGVAMEGISEWVGNCDEKLMQFSEVQASYMLLAILISLFLTSNGK
jgi:hypothetical protein